jgi:hypothetical protein
MLQTNHSQNFATYPGQPIVPVRKTAVYHEQEMYAQLAQLSYGRQWILFTAQCPRPSQSQLSDFDINCNTIIHMKPSINHSEEEIVIKAIQSRNASAIVASDQLGYTAKSHILDCAAAHGCKVFFLDGSDAKARTMCH